MAPRDEALDALREAAKQNPEWVLSEFRRTLTTKTGTLRFRVASSGDKLAWSLAPIEGEFAAAGTSPTAAFAALIGALENLETGPRDGELVGLLPELRERSATWVLRSGP